VVGSIVLLLLGGFVWVAGALALIVACWLANRILGPAPAAAAPLSSQPESPAYRTVEAGPYTSPATAQDGPGHVTEEAIPTPSFLRALVIMAGTMLGAIGSFALLGYLTWHSAANEEESFLMMIGLGLGATAGLHVLLLVLALPTTLPRALLVLVLEAVPLLLLIGVPVLVLGFAVFSVRSSGPPPAMPAPVAPTPPPVTAPMNPAPSPTAPE
jgi:hypothetical protein